MQGKQSGVMNKAVWVRVVWRLYCFKMSCIIVYIPYENQFMSHRMTKPTK